MKRILCFFTFLFILTSIQIFAQQKDVPTENIFMKDAALFVRLQTSQLKIDALNRAGNKEEAEKIRVAQKDENESIIEAFKDNFNFCKVYFFYSNHSTEVKEGKYKGLIYDVSMKLDTTFSGSNYFIGEYDKSGTNRLEGFLIKDKNYKYLWAAAPHQVANPYFVRKNKYLFVQRTHDEVVETLNLKLHNYVLK